MMSWKTILGFGVTLGACSVPTQAGYTQQLDALKGSNVSGVIRDWGAPTSTTDLAAGHRVYEWNQKSGLRTEERIVHRVDPQTNQGYYAKEGGVRIPLDCRTTMEADAQGRIVWATAEGLACVGFSPVAPVALEVPAAVAPVAVPAAVAPEAAVEVPVVPAVPAEVPVRGSPGRRGRVPAGEKESGRRGSR